MKKIRGCAGKGLSGLRSHYCWMLFQKAELKHRERERDRQRKREVGAGGGFLMWTYGREVENKIAPWLLRWEWYLFSWALARRHALYPAFVLQSRESPCFNACRLTMHCYYTVFMFTSCVIWPKESLQSERAHAKFMLIRLFQSVEKINTAGLMRRNDWVLSDWH